MLLSLEPPVPVPPWYLEIRRGGLRDITEGFGGLEGFMFWPRRMFCALPMYIYKEVGPRPSLLGHSIHSRTFVLVVHFS